MNNVIKVWLQRRRIYSHEYGYVFLCKCVPVLTLDVLQIAEDPEYVGRLTNLAKSGYFSAVLSLLQKSTDPASCFYASRSHIFCNASVFTIDDFTTAPMPLQMNHIGFTPPIGSTYTNVYVNSLLNCRFSPSTFLFTSRCHSFKQSI